MGAVPSSSDHGNEDTASASAAGSRQLNERDAFESRKSDFSAGTVKSDASTRRDPEYADDGDDDDDTTKSVMILTDLPEVLPLLETNAIRSREDHGQEHFSTGVSHGNHAMTLTAGEGLRTKNDVDLRVRSLPWGDRAAAERILSEVGEITHILCSDLVSSPRLSNVVF